MATTTRPPADSPEELDPISPGADSGNSENKDRPPRSEHAHSTRYWVVFVLLLLAAALIVVFAGWLPRHKREQQINQQAQEQKSALPRVQVVKIDRAPSESELSVPGTTQAYTEASIYARASGYVVKRLADIGDHVHAGQLLAIIDSPELDQQVAQARSNLRQSESNLNQLQAQLRLASLTWDRYKVLVARGVFSRQEGDTQEANYRVSEANVRAAENTVQGNRDNLQRLIVLQGYERVAAPFDGVVTARNIDLGTLITAQGSGAASSSEGLPGSTQAGAQANNAGTSGNVSSSTAPSTGGSQGGALFTISDTNRFRVLVSVPEAYSSVVRVGQRAKLSFQEVPNEVFQGQVSRTSSSIDQNTRTLLVEVQVRNHNGVLMPGMYAQVNLIEAKDVPPIVIPGEAIVVRNGQTIVALVENDVVHFRPVRLGRDYGNETEITDGLKPGDLVAVDISDAVSEGAKIQPELRQQKSPQRGGQSDSKPDSEGRYGNQNASNQGSKAAASANSKKGSSSKK